MDAAQLHRRNHLSFRYDDPRNSAIVRFFLDHIVVRDGRAVATADVKHEAIRRWGYTDAFAGMFRAFRVYRRVH